jgi:asparaginyl-tRNA synthetase
MKHTKVKVLLSGSQVNTEVNAKGWVRTFRNNQFIALNDGSTINNIQCVVDFENTPEETLKRITTGAAVSVTGKLVESQGAGQKYEIQATSLEILGDSDAENFQCNPKNTRWNFYVKMRICVFELMLLEQLCEYVPC